MRKLVNYERGAVAYFVALFFVIIVGSLSFALNMGSSRSLKSDLQNTVDTAAQLAASTLCSTRSCYEDALEIALNVIQENVSSGLARTSISLDNPNELFWENDDIAITIRRGRWWNTSNPYTLELSDAFIHQESRHHNFIFEDLDRQLDAGATWQTVHSETPAFLVANAIYVSITFQYQNSFFNIFNISKMPITAKAYALAGDVAEEKCIAPFALPVCSLVSDSGDLYKDNACQIERYFTESDRYCPPGEDCNVLPGTFYVPFPQEDKLTSTHVFGVPYYESHYHATGKADDSGGTSGDTFYKATCDFDTLKLPGISISDHYGVTGLALDSFPTATTPNLSESDIRLAVEAGCRKARIGDPFQIRPEGFTEFDSQLTVWQQIINQLPLDSEVGEYMRHPTFRTEFERSIFNVFLPSIESHFTSTSDHQTMIQKVSCWGADAPAERYGVCNSQRFFYNTECFARRNVDKDDLSKDLYTPDILPCPIGNSLHEILESSTGRRTWDLESYYNDSKVWKAAVPIISTLEGDDRYCRGIQNGSGVESTSDPLISNVDRYYIIGFVDVIFYDADIGISPPVPFDEIAYKDYSEIWNNQWSADEEPWGFNKGAPGCNVVKGMIDCNQGLLSTPQFELQNNRPVRLVIPEES